MSEEKISLDELVKEWIIIRMSPLEKSLMTVKKLEFNNRVGEYAKQEGILGYKAWGRIKQQAHKLVMEALGIEENTRK